MFQVSNAFLASFNFRLCLPANVCRQLFMLRWIRANFVASCEKRWHMFECELEIKKPLKLTQFSQRFRCWIFQKCIQPTLRKQMVLVYEERAIATCVCVRRNVYVLLIEMLLCVFTSAKSSSSGMSVIGAPLKRWSAPLWHRLSLFWSAW